MEQFDFDFASKPEKHADPASLSDDDLAALYKETIGVDPKYRAFDRETLIRGLTNGRDAERARIKFMDDEENRESIAATRVS